MISNILNQFSLLNYSISSEILLVISTLVLIILGVKRGDKSTYQVTILAIFSLLAVLLLSFHSSSSVEMIADNYVLDNFIKSVRSLIMIAAILSLVLYVGHLNYNIRNARFEYPIIITASVIGMLIMVSANDFLTLYMGLELQSLAIYVLVAINRKSLKSSEAGLKYFILGALSSAILLYGISFIYGFSGTIYFEPLSELMAADKTPIGILVGMVFTIVALCFKVSAVPFHMWTPDVYEGSPTPVTVFISSAPKVAALVIMLRVLTEPLAIYYDDWQQIIAFVAIASLLVGAVGAIRQTNFKRLIAYSSINHVGFMLLAILVFSEAGLRALLIYMTLYVTMIIGSFAFLMIIKQAHRSADEADKKPLEDISTFSSLSSSMPLIAISMAILLFSMAGIPPFAGFFGKFHIFKILLAEGFYNIAIVAALSSVIAVFYYLKIVKIMFFDQGNEIYDKKPTIFTVFVFILVVLFNLLFFVEPNFFFDFSQYSTDLIL